jgi:predicted SAM-dependent methyltransferase
MYTLFKTIFKELRLKYKINTCRKIKLVIGAGGNYFDGWISTDNDILDITNPLSWGKKFKNKKIDNILAEHVFEHLNFRDVKKALFYIYDSLKVDGILRFAVPDGYHPSVYVRELTKPNGLEPGADDHKVFFNIDMVEKLAEENGFELDRIEYFDKNGVFHTKEFNFENGYISRCSKNYKGRFTDDQKEYNKLINSVPEHLRQQFIDNKISYTSLFVDFIKGIK